MNVQQWSKEHDAAWTQYGDSLLQAYGMACDKQARLDASKQTTLDATWYDLEYATAYAKRAFRVKPGLRIIDKVSKRKKKLTSKYQARELNADESAEKRKRERSMEYNTLALDAVQLGFIYWKNASKSISTKLAICSAVRDTMKAYRDTRKKGNPAKARNANPKYVEPLQGTMAQNNKKTDAQKRAPAERACRNLDLEMLELEDTDISLVQLVRVLATGGTQADASRLLQCSPQNITKMMNKLRSLGTEYYGYYPSNYVAKPINTDTNDEWPTVDRRKEKRILALMSDLGLQLFQLLGESEPQAAPLAANNIPELVAAKPVKPKYWTMAQPTYASIGMDDSIPMR